MSNNAWTENQVLSGLRKRGVTLENINPKEANEDMYTFEYINDDCAPATCFGDYSTDRATPIKNRNKRATKCTTNTKIDTCMINIELR